MRESITLVFCENWRWSSPMENMKSRGRSWIQIQLLLPYIYLNRPLIPNPTPNPSHLHPLSGSNSAPWTSCTAMRYWKTAAPHRIALE